MEKSKIYTKMGDNGETGLVGGTRISKSDSRIDLYGEVDELNSWIGVALCFMPEQDFVKEVAFLKNIQSSLFDLGSNLACEAEQRATYKLPNLSESIIKGVEAEIDRYDHECPKLKNFILPGGDKAAAHFHLCRTVCRKIERKMIHFRELHKEELPELAAPFINRLSDYFFVLSRFINVKKGIVEVAWVPQA